jgi:hypothetical protein
MRRIGRSRALSNPRATFPPCPRPCSALYVRHSCKHIVDAADAHGHHGLYHIHSSRRARGRASLTYAPPQHTILALAAATLEQVLNAASPCYHPIPSLPIRVSLHSCAIHTRSSLAVSADLPLPSSASRIVIQRFGPSPPHSRALILQAHVSVPHATTPRQGSGPSRRYLELKQKLFLAPYRALGPSHAVPVGICQSQAAVQLSLLALLRSYPPTAPSSAH